MREYAIIRNGVVVNVVMTSKTPFEIRQSWPERYEGYDIKPLSEVSSAALQSYQYWDERP